MVDAIGNSGLLKPEEIMQQIAKKIQAPQTEEKTAVYADTKKLTEETLQDFIDNPAKDIGFAHGNIDTSSDIVSKVLAGTDPHTVDLLNESASVNTLSEDGILTTQRIASRLDAMLEKAKQLNDTLDESFAKNNITYKPIDVIA